MHLVSHCLGGDGACVLHVHHERYRRRRQVKLERGVHGRITQALVAIYYMDVLTRYRLFRLDAPVCAGLGGQAHFVDVGILEIIKVPLPEWRDGYGWDVVRIIGTRCRLQACGTLLPFAVVTNGLSLRF